MHHKCAIHAALDDNRLRPKRLDPLRRSHDALFFAQKTRLGFVQHEHVDHRQNALQIGIRRINPQIHRIGGNEFRLRLLDDFELQMRNDIGEEEEIAILLSIAQIGLEIGKHVQIGAKRRRLGQIIAVCPLPLERFALLRIDRRQIDATFDEKIELRTVEIIAQYRNDLGATQQPCRCRKIRCRSAQTYPIVRPRCRYRIQRYRTHDDER